MGGKTEILDMFHSKKCMFYSICFYNLTNHKNMKIKNRKNIWEVEKCRL